MRRFADLSKAVSALAQPAGTGSCPIAAKRRASPQLSFDWPFTRSSTACYSRISHESPNSCDRYPRSSAHALARASTSSEAKARKSA
jgi:hypothetical protein